MSFTCPDCLWTSHHPMDEQQSYCAHCHAFKPGPLHPSPMQRSCIRAIRNQDPLSTLSTLVTSAFELAAMKAPPAWPDSDDESRTQVNMARTLISEMMPLADARKITDKQRSALRTVIGTTFATWLRGVDTDDAPASSERVNDT